MTGTMVRRRAVAIFVVLFSLLYLGGCAIGGLVMGVAWFLPGGQQSTSTTLPRARVGSFYDVHIILFDLDPKPPNCAGPGGQKLIIDADAPDKLANLKVTAVSDSEARLSGTPDKAGEFEISAFANKGRFNGVPCEAVDRLFTLTIDPSEPLSIETDPRLTDGRVNEAYPGALISATGGTSPYTWSDTAGDLPGGHGRAATPCEGLSADLSVASPSVSGTPVSEGDCVFTLQVKDAVDATASREFTVHVQPAGGGNPVPTITALTPSSKNAGDPAFPLTVTGTGFVSGSDVRWNGTHRETTFVSATELTADIAAADIADPGTAQVTVFNPAPGGGTSAAKAFPISAPPGELERVSVSTNGEEGDSSSGATSGDSHPIAVSEDGRFVVFTSSASNLAPGADNGGNNVEDVFVRDTCRGASAPDPCDKTTSRITGPAAPEPGNDYVDITADGQWITFTSSGIDGGVWVAPRSGGAAVRLTSTDAEVRFSSFFNPAISDDGRFVVVHTPFGFVPEDTNLFFSDIYLFDRDADENGVFDEAPATVTLISATPSGAAGNGASVDADVSANGRYVVFSSAASDLVPGVGPDQVYLRDTCIGATGCTAATTLISVGPSAPGNALSLHPRITPDARYVVFDSAATNLLPPGGDTNAFLDIYVHDTCIGAGSCTPSNIRATRAANGGETNESSVRPSISADGRFVAFESQADNLVSGFSASSFIHVFATDTCIGAAGCTPKTNLLSQVDGSLGNSGSRSAVISPDGRFVDFESRASNLVADDANGVGDIFLSGSGVP